MALTKTEFMIFIYGVKTDDAEMQQFRNTTQQR